MLGRIKESIKKARVSENQRRMRDSGQSRMRKEGGFRTDRGLCPYVGTIDGEVEIGRLIDVGSPAMIARAGSVELEFINDWRHKSSSEPKKEKSLARLCTNAGFFPKNGKFANRFIDTFIAAQKNVDLYGAWCFRHGLWDAEEWFFSFTSELTLLGDIRSINRFQESENPWTGRLKGKRVLVIHPFKQSIESQYLKRESLFEDSRILPEFGSLQVIEAVQSIADSEVDFSDWFVALDHMKNEIQKYSFDVALIGAGAYGFPLASFVKESGKVAIHTGGATQFLFGIKGKRWENKYGAVMNKYWTDPLDSETPKGYEKVEGGCYW